MRGGYAACSKDAGRMPNAISSSSTPRRFCIPRARLRRSRTQRRWRVMRCCPDVRRRFSTALSRRAMAEPAGILGQIAASKREELRRRFGETSIDALRARATPTALSLKAALATPGARLILEIKKASPSAGPIRSSADPAAIARGYAGVADALSVLCDKTYFGGSLADLTAARGEFDGPILAKDFFMDPRQVVEARIAGADAVLVMLSLLDDFGAGQIIDEARRLDMDALVKVHDESEM